MARILVVDDERGMRDFLAILLQQQGYEVVVAESGEEALGWIQKEIFDLVLTDLRLGGMSGLEVLREVKETSPDTLVILITAYASHETAVQAMRDGAYDYISKPFHVEEIKITLRRALERRRLTQENQLLRRELQGRGSLHDLRGVVGRSPAMAQILEMIRKIADSPSTVLITGESGTGKERVARAVHLSSNRRHAPFVAVNCAGIPEGLLESELFGHVKGAFTGAVSNKMGLFEAAHHGTLFLDEIGELPLSLQAKLLRVLQDKTIKRVGGVREVQVDVRIIAATNQDLPAAVAEGRFREDLFYRLNVIPIHIPPLRDRKEDIPPLVEWFLKRYGTLLGRPRIRITPEALERLLDHPWKGNVRELENVLERAIALADRDVLSLEDIESSLGRGYLRPSPPADSVEIPPGGMDLEGLLADLERRYLLKALERSRGVKKEAARLLGLDFRSFRYRLAKYGLNRGEKEVEEVG